MISPAQAALIYEYYQCADCLVVRKRRQGTAVYEEIDNKEEIVAARLMGLLPEIRKELTCTGCRYKRNPQRWEKD